MPDCIIWLARIFTSSAANYARARNWIWSDVATEAPCARRAIDPLDDDSETRFPLPEEKGVALAKKEMALSFVGRPTGLKRHFVNWL